MPQCKAKGAILSTDPVLLSTQFITAFGLLLSALVAALLVGRWLERIRARRATELRKENFGELRSEQLQ